jgi:hypothetical protein
MRLTSLAIQSQMGSHLMFNRRNKPLVFFQWEIFYQHQAKWQRFSIQKNTPMDCMTTGKIS